MPLSPPRTRMELPEAAPGWAAFLFLVTCLARVSGRIDRAKLRTAGRKAAQDLRRARAFPQVNPDGSIYCRID